MPVTPKKRMAVLLNVVYNHFGPVGNYTGRFGPYTTDRHGTPWGDAINLEFEESDEVRRFFCDNALMWMREFHIDGLRLDAVHEYMDPLGDQLHGAACHGGRTSFGKRWAAVGGLSPRAI